MNKNNSDPNDNTTTPSGAFDLALYTYTASEIPTTEASLAAAALLFDKLSDNGLLVMIEPGTPDGFQNVRSVRQILLDCCPPSNMNSSEEEDEEEEEEERYGAFVVAPCTHNGLCPMDRDRLNNINQSNNELHHFSNKKGEGKSVLYGDDEDDDIFSHEDDDIDDEDLDDGIDIHYEDDDGNIDDYDDIMDANNDNVDNENIKNKKIKEEE